MLVDVYDMDHLGQGIAKDNNKVCFIPKAITGDTCEVSVYKEHKNYNKCMIDKIVSPSKDRIDTVCPYYEHCGGCNIRALDYQKQLSFKKDKVVNIFKKYLDMDINPEIIPSKESEYRNKITYHVRDGKIGLIGEFNELVDIDNCLLVSDKINGLYRMIKEIDLSLVKTVTIKECDNGLILSIQGKMNIDSLKNKCIGIYMDNELVYNQEEGYIKINDIKYRVSDKSFFQVNTSNISKLYDEVIKAGEFTKEDKVIDLYSGVGSISLYIAKYVKEVLGIEIVRDAIDDAIENAKINGISNAKFICGDVSKLIDNNINCEKLIVDPPRIGLDNKTVDVINASGIDRVIYVSCNPMTLVRDIKSMNNYKVSKITLIDMFPQTHHVESVCVLERK